MPHRFICALDSFKGCLSSAEAAEAIQAGIVAVFPDAAVTTVVVADGGEGTVEALTRGTNGRFVEVVVSGPLGAPTSAQMGILPTGAAVIEMAAAAGITLIPSVSRNPWLTSTFGLGELIRCALDQGVRDFLIGIGGSATNDAGTGMLQALGWQFLDQSGRIIQKRGGQILSEIADFSAAKIDPRLRDCRVTVACDVQNPFSGPNGAACVYGPQKGADEDMVKNLDAGLKNFAQVIQRKTGIDLNSLPGAGAAGGLGGGLFAFLGAKLESGIEMVLQSQDFDKKLFNADLVFSGEGRIDAQTVFGKVVAGIARRAKQVRVPVVALAGSVSDLAALNQEGVTAAFAIQPGPSTLQEAMNPVNAYENIRRTAEQICRLYAINNPLK